ncbi:MAG: ATP-dependent helicase, partial [Candidatus Spyradocola sp.]
MQEAFFARLEREKGVRLNEEQRAAVAFGRGIALLAAAPGSGKTTVAVCRAARLLEEGAGAERVWTLTFSRRSREDLGERFGALFPGRRAPCFSTLHAMSLRILREAAERAGRELYGVLGDPGPTVRRLLRRQGIREPGEELLLEACSALERETSDPGSGAEAEGFDLARLAREYAQEKREKRLMDFADMQVYALRALSRDAALLRLWQGRMDYVQVDEAQDTSPVQQKLAALLAGGCGNLLFIGDADQSIYGFRGAEPSFLNGFEAAFPGARVLALPVNFRSRPEIVAAAGRVIRWNAGRRDLRMRAFREAGGVVERAPLADWGEQAAYVCRRARALAPGKTLGVLYRNNDSAGPLCDALLRAEIPFALSREGGSERLLGAGSRDLSDLARLVLDPSDAPAFARVRGLLAGGGLPAESLARAAQAGGDCIQAVLRQKGVPAKALERLRASGAALAALRGKPTPEVLRGLCRTFRLTDHRYDGLRALAREEADLRQLLLRAEALPALIDEQTAHSRGARVLLSTVHAAKGLEYDEVVLVDAMEGVFPPRGPGAARIPETRRQLEEETRLM